MSFYEFTIVCTFVCLQHSHQTYMVHLGEQGAMVEIIKKLWTQYNEMNGLTPADMPFTGLFWHGFWSEFMFLLFVLGYLCHGCACAAFSRGVSLVFAATVLCCIPYWPALKANQLSWRSFPASCVDVYSIGVQLSSSLVFGAISMARCRLSNLIALKCATLDMEQDGGAMACNAEHTHMHACANANVTAC